MEKTLNPFYSTPSAILLGSVIIAISILIHGGFIKIKGLEGSAASAPATTAAQPAVAAGQPAAPTKADATLGNLPIKGSNSAKVAVLEFADLRCPFCKRFFDTTEPQLLTDYVNNGKVKFAFRHFEFLGPASVTAGNAAECANEQGKFWDMYDYFYKNQPDESDTSMFTTDKLTPIATGLGMNGSQFSTCLDATKYAKNLTDDYADGQKAGVNGTPSFVIGKLDSSGKKIIGGQVIAGAVPYATLKAAIDQSLK